jgi:hypothetical protein
VTSVWIPEGLQSLLLIREQFERDDARRRVNNLAKVLDEEGGIFPTPADRPPHVPGERNHQYENK